MKKSSKQVQGCKKISSYFKVQTINKNSAPKSTQNASIVISDSDEDDTVSTNKRKFDGNRTNFSPPLKKTSSDEEKTELPIDNGSVAGLKIPLKTLALRNIEELLSPQALKVYRSPEKQTPKKQNFNSTKKQSPNVTVSKTPKKLFERSPNNINKFNVGVLKNFVKISPKIKQCNSDSEKLLSVESANERTPTKSGSCTISSTERVRTQLDFTSCDVASSSQAGNSRLEQEQKENFDFGNINFDDSFGEEFIVEKNYTLDLSNSERCQVVDVNPANFSIFLTLQSTKTDEQAVCQLRGFWIDSKLNVGDVVHVTALKTEDNQWIIDNKNGYLIYEPDLLISATSIASSVFCKRKVYFSEKFRGFDPTNKYMIVGSLVHTLLQDTFVKKAFKLQEIQAHANELLHKRSTIRDIYASGEPFEVIKEDFYVYIPKICEFVSKYAPGGSSTQIRSSGDWKGTISSIEDIEENIWCPSLGIKGKVDITIKNGCELLPVEVKSGRATVSVEHRGQVLLYIMMMNKLGYKISSGLLLYLKEGILKEIPPTQAEQTGLMMLRNDLAYYLSKRPTLAKTTSGLVVEPSEVPEPSDNRFCNTCPYNAVCVTHSRYFNEDISSLQTLGKVDAELKDVITPGHVNYFMHWSSLLTMELSGNREDHKYLKDIYTLTPNERKKKGKCLVNLTLENVRKDDDRLFIHTFADSPSGDNGNFSTSGFNEGNYIVLSSEARPAVASGFITAITARSITVTLERDLRVKYNKQHFFLDSYDSMSLLTTNMASLSLILDTTDEANRFRRIIVDRRPATFRAKIPKAVAVKGKPILKRLNKVQQKAVLKAIAAEDYFLIKGMPGTGKTSTVVALIQLLVELGKTVLITSHTHSAVDNVCLKLMLHNVKFMRLGNKMRIDKKIWNYAEESLIKGCSTPEQLEVVYNSVQVVAVTCLGASHVLLTRRTFDICLVDESTQVVQCSIFRPIFASKTFVLIGDPDQLPAVIQNRDALELGMDESLFERLDNEESRVDLNLNYRMNERITTLANALTYQGHLHVATAAVGKATLHLPKLEFVKCAYSKLSWVVRALDNNLENAVQLIDTGPVWNLTHVTSWPPSVTCRHKNEQDKLGNIYEAAVIFHLVEALIKGGLDPDKIGVIATFRAQVVQLTAILEHTKVEINTVDQYQGKDKSIVICSCSKSVDTNKEWNSNKFELLESKRRLNVAITRAKHKLIIVGDWTTLQNYSTFKNIKNELETNALKLFQVAGFDWDAVLDMEGRKT